VKREREEQQREEAGKKKASSCEPYNATHNQPFPNPGRVGLTAAWLKCDVDEGRDGKVTTATMMTTMTMGDGDGRWAMARAMQRQSRPHTPRPRHATPRHATHAKR